MIVNMISRISNPLKHDSCVSGDWSEVQALPALVFVCEHDSFSMCFTYRSRLSSPFDEQDAQRIETLFLAPRLEIA